jgi:hypothetical protein
LLSCHLQLSLSSLSFYSLPPPKAHRLITQGLQRAVTVTKISAGTRKTIPAPQLASGILDAPDENIVRPPVILEWNAHMALFLSLPNYEHSHLLITFTLLAPFKRLPTPLVKM